MCTVCAQLSVGRSRALGSNCALCRACKHMLGAGAVCGLEPSCAHIASTVEHQEHSAQCAQFADWVQIERTGEHTRSTLCTGEHQGHSVHIASTCEHQENNVHTLQAQVRTRSSPRRSNTAFLCIHSSAAAAHSRLAPFFCKANGARTSFRMYCAHFSVFGANICVSQALHIIYNVHLHDFCLMMNSSQWSYSYYMCV